MAVTPPRSPAVGLAHVTVVPTNYRPTEHESGAEASDVEREN